MTATKSETPSETEPATETPAEPGPRGKDETAEADAGAPAGGDEGTEAAPEGAAPAEAAPAAGDAEDEPSPEAEIADLKDKLLRAVAETENLRRRASREKEDAAKYAISRFARDVLAIADNLRRALESAPAERSDEAADNGEALEGLIAGVEVTERELLAVMERHGIRPIDPMGEKFDHNFHQAMFEVETAERPPGTVVRVLQTGYVIADRLLRPAMVGVAKGGSPAAEAEPQPDENEDADPPPEAPGDAAAGEKVDIHT